MRVFLLFLAMAANARACETLGFNNKNPGNLIAHGCKWESASGRDAWGHLQFSDMRGGLFAIGEVLHTYKARYHIHTLERLCGRWVWAKADQAGKRNWLSTLRKRMNAKPGQRFDFDDPMTRNKLAHAIVWAENSCDDIDEGTYTLALGE